MRRVYIAVCLALVAGAVLSCKSSPSSTIEPPQPEATGEYLGWGRPAGQGRNTYLNIRETSTANVYEGAIAYGGETTLLDSIRVSATADSVWFSYERGARIRLLGVTTGVDVTLFTLSTPLYPTYSLNRVMRGNNLSGNWNGRMTSEYFQDEAAADLFLDHQGDLVSGEVTAQYIVLLEAAITSGGVNGNNFFLRGTVALGGTSYPAYFDGVFQNPDSLHGTWSVGSPPLDGGSCAFSRDF